jgi:hypothetical protein
MKVPTYRRETGITAETGARALRVQASPGAVSAGTRAATQFFDQATQESLSWYETELRNKRDADEMAALNEADERMNVAIEQSRNMDPDEAETYFDTEVRLIQNDMKGRFDSELRQTKFNGQLERDAITRRVGVRRDATNRRIDKQIGVIFQREEILQTQAINGSTEIERQQARTDLNALYTDATNKQYLSAQDAERRRLSSMRLITKERAIAEITGLGSIEQLEAYKQGLLENPPPELAPSTITQLLNLTEADINDILSAENRAEILEERLAGKVSEEELFRLRLQVRNMSSEEVSAFYNRLLAGETPDFLDARDNENLITFVESRISSKNAQITAAKKDVKSNLTDLKTINANGDLVDPKTYRNLLQQAIQLGDQDLVNDVGIATELNESMTTFRTMSPAMVDDQIRKIESIPVSGLSTQQQLLRSETLEQAEKYRANMESALEAGNSLDWLSRTGNINVTPFDFNNIGDSIALRRSAITNAEAFLSRGEQVDLPYQTNFFTPSEMRGLQSYVNNATPQQKVELAFALQPVNNFAPQIWEQLDKSGARLFAVAGAIGDSDIAEQVFIGQSLIDAKTVDRPTETEYMPVLQDYVGDVYRLQGSPGENEQVVMEAILAHYAATRLDRFEFKESEFRKSMEAVTGGIGEYNGFKLELPRGVNEDRFNRWIDKFTPGMLEYFAPDGLVGMTNEQAIDLMRRSRIQSISNNKYAVVYSATNQEALFKSDGMPLVIEWNEDMSQMLGETQQRTRRRQTGVQRQGIRVEITTGESE